MLWRSQMCLTIINQHAFTKESQPKMITCRFPFVKSLFTKSQFINLDSDSWIATLYALSSHLLEKSQATYLKHHDDPCGRNEGQNERTKDHFVQKLQATYSQQWQRLHNKHCFDLKCTEKQIYPMHELVSMYTVSTCTSSALFSSN